MVSAHPEVPASPADLVFETLLATDALWQQ